MEGSEAELVRSILAAWERGDWRATPGLLADDVQMTASQPEGQLEARGPEATVRFMAQFLADWERYWLELHELEARGNGRYLATATQRGIGRASGVEITAPAVIAITMRDGLMAQVEFHFEREAGLAALERF